MSKRKKKAISWKAWRFRAWKPVRMAIFFLGIGLVTGAGLALFFVDRPAIPKIATVTAKLADTTDTAFKKTKLRPQWVREAVPEPAIKGRPMIAIILDDLGMSRARTADAIQLSAPLTLAFLPYANGLWEQTTAARAAGHELLIHVPMEPQGKNDDPGPHALMVHMTQDEILENLSWDFDRFEHYVGINNHMGSKFTKDPDRLAMVFRELKARGLLFIDSRTTADSVAKKLAREIGVPFAERQVFLDNFRSAENVRERLEKLELIARRDGAAIGIGHPHKVTLAALREWLPTLLEKGFVLVPASTIVRRQLKDAAGR